MVLIDILLNDLFFLYKIGSGITSRSNKRDNLDVLKPMSSYLSFRYNSHSRTRSSSKYEFDPINHTMKLLETPRINTQLAKENSSN